MIKQCKRCGEEKDISKFYTIKTRNNQILSKCKSCMAEEALDRRHNNPYRYWAIDTLEGHARNGNIIDMTRDELEDIARNTSKCPICGRNIAWGLNPTARDNSPSLDRIFNENLISKDTVMIICHRCNTTKGPRTLEEFIRYCEYVVSIKEELLL